MSGLSFPLVGMLASRVAAHFTHAHKHASGGSDPAPLPTPAAIELLIDAAFWASLRREEGRTPTISLTLLPPGGAASDLIFAEKLPLEPASLVKLAPAVAQPGIHLGVWVDGGVPAIWGAVRTLPRLALVIEVVSPGRIVVKRRREPFEKFINVAVLEGDEIKILDDQAASGMPDALRALVQAEGLDDVHAVGLLIDLAASMRAHGRGGTLLVVPPASTWMESIVAPVRYVMSPPFRGATMFLECPPPGIPEDEWRAGRHRAIDTIAGLTAVDGATVLSTSLELFAFGAKIARRRGQPTVERVIVSEPIEGNVATVAAPVQLGGTRHLSAAQFVHDQREAGALVASQDGRFTVFRWSASDDAVHAKAIETLLL